MTVGYHLNIEPVLISIVDDELAQMTSHNVLDSEDGLYVWLDDEALANNLRHGLPALMIMCLYAECVINDLVRIKFNEKHPYPEILKSEHQMDYLRALKMGYDDQVKKVLGIRIGDNASQELVRSWNDMKDTFKIRNEIAHYKINFMQDATMPDSRTWTLPGSTGMSEPRNKASRLSVGIFFTSLELSKRWNHIRRAISIIVEQSGAVFVSDIGIVQADGRDGVASYVESTALLKCLREGYESDLES